MAKRKLDISSADVLKRAKTISPAYRALCSIKEQPTLPPKVLRDWLSEETEKCNNACCDLHSRVDHIRHADFDVRNKAFEIMMCGLDFLDVAEEIMPQLGDDQDPRIAMAFTAGVRLGLLRDKLQSLADGRYDFRWGTSKGGTNSAKLKDDREILLLKSAYANNKNHKDWLKRTTNELRERHGITTLSEKTVSRKLKKHGITDSSSVVRRQK